MGSNRPRRSPLDAGHVAAWLERSRELLELLDDVEHEHAVTLARVARVDPALTGAGLHAVHEAVERACARVVGTLASLPDGGDRHGSDAVLREALATLASLLARVLAARALAERSLDAQLAGALDEEAAAWSVAASELGAEPVWPAWGSPERSICDEPR